MRWVFASLWIGAVTLVAAPLAFAHSGGTDAKGCHTCRTNCAKWGLQDGEYHCHERGGRSERQRPVAPEVPSEVFRSSGPKGRLIPINPPKGSQARTVLRVDGMAVVDGDTFVVRQGGELYLLRLRDIEAPEVEKPHGPEARDRLTSLVMGRTLLVEVEQGSSCVIAVRAKTLEEGEQISQMLVAEGLARVKPEAPEILKVLEERARKERKGLWGDSDLALSKKFQGTGKGQPKKN